MCYLDLLAETFKQKSLFFFFLFISFFFPSPKDPSSISRATLFSMCGSWSLAEAPCRRTGLLFGE